MEDLFRWVDKYAMLEDNVRAVSHVVRCTFTDENIRPIDRPITFPSIDSNWVILLHKDVLVLTLGVDGFDMHKILIDPGNSVGLSQVLAYRQMRYSSSSLENLGCILTRFNGPMIIFLGDVVFLVQANLVILNVCFSMMEDLLTYNAIMK
ncbi:hypothetical protein AAG906_026811 [Vitis piasezkii]